MGTTKAQRKTKGAPGKVRNAARRAHRKDRTTATLRNKAKRIAHEALKAARNNHTYTAPGWSITVNGRKVTAIRQVSA